jgi:5'-deoxynucleotidase YfbR-like HD superfamily hydrolase
LVEQIASALNPNWPPRWQLAALLHDAPEYVIGDLISPFKTAIGLDYRAFEAKLLAAVHRRFGLPAPLPPEVAAEIKRADRIAAFFEATILAGFAREEAERFFGDPAGIEGALARYLEGICSLPSDAAQRSFLARFGALEAAM